MFVTIFASALLLSVPGAFHSHVCFVQTFNLVFWRINAKRSYAQTQTIHTQAEFVVCSQMYL